MNWGLQISPTQSGSRWLILWSSRTAWVLWLKAATQALLGADGVVSDERLGLSGRGDGPAGLWSHVHRLCWWWEMRMWTEGLWAFWTPEWLTGERGIHRTLKHMPLAIIFIWYIWKAPLHGRKRGGWSLFQKCSNKKKAFSFWKPLRVPKEYLTSLWPGVLAFTPNRVYSASWRPSPVAQTVKSLPAVQQTEVRSLGQEDPLEESMATHSSILAWRLPWTEEPGGLQSMGVEKTQHDLSDGHFPFGELHSPLLPFGSQRGLNTVNCACV